MIDKSKRKANAERFGDIVAIRMTGGPDCLWLNMYLDTETWQMTCDSDIGPYSYHWPRDASKDGFIEVRPNSEPVYHLSHPIAQGCRIRRLLRRQAHRLPLGNGKRRARAA